MNKLFKSLLSLALVASLGLAVVACGQKKEASKKLRVGATPVPHAELLELVKEDLKQEGIELEVEVYNDYVIPNKALAEGSLDANFFQHVPYLETFSKENKLDLASIGGVHLEPLAVFSKKYKSLDDLKENDEILFPNDPTNAARALLLLQSKGLIKLKDGGALTSTEQDIVENPKNLRFTALEAALIPKSYDGVAAAVINGNYAIQNQLNPAKDSIAIEGSESPYVNIIAVKTADVKRADVQKLLTALQSEKVKKFIEEKYEGAVVPAFTKAQ